MHNVVYTEYIDPPKDGRWELFLWVFPCTDLQTSWLDQIRSL